MDIKISESIAYLKACIDTNRTNDAAQHIENIEHNFDANLSNSEIDLNLNILFNGTNGLIVFLWKTIKLNKTFKDSNVQIFTLIIKLIVQYKAKFQQYSKITIEVCLKFILSTSVTAKEKEKAVQLLQELVLNKLCADVDISNVLQELIRVVNLKNPTARFLQYTYELLGMLARDFPECMLAGNDKRIRDLYFNTLETKLLKIEDFSFYELTGALQGFNYYLVTCAPSKSEEPQICQRIYVCVKKLSDPGDITRRSAFRSALNLLANHGSLFSEQLFNDNQYWHTVLLNWLNLSSWEDRKSAIYALHTLHREIARMLQLRNNPNDINVLKFFINYFKTTLQLAQSQSYEIRIAICGFGVMAEPCKTLLPPEYLNNLLMLVIQRTEYAILENRSINKDNLEYFPDFVQSLSQIMNQINELTGIQISSLENIIVVLIKEFHFLSTAHHSLVVNSLISTFYNLSRLGETILNDLLEKIILQGVIWTCSHKLLIEANIDWENITDWKENTTYKFYLPLWNGLLTMNNIESNNVDQFTHQIIIRKIYEYLMKSLFTILDKLDLATTKRIYKDSVTGEDQDLYFCDPNYDLMPSKPKDFHIFFNLIDFYMDLLGTQTIDTHRENFQQWIHIYCETIISKSIKYPLISGFIKLLKTGLNIGNKIEYFNELNADHHVSMCTTNRDFLFDNLIYFLKNIILKCQQSTGELQLSCLQLLFTVPIILIKDIVMDLIPIFHIGFDIGKSMLSIAHMALTSLEKITELIINNNNNNINAKNSSKNANEQFLIKVLPCLDPYLQTKGFLIDKKMDIEIIKFKKSLKAKRIYKQIDADSELLKLQRRIILYLGTLEPKNCLHLISSEKSKENLIKWDVEQNIRLTLHFKDMETTIYLDALIPRICTLAITSSDRKTKIAATELVHGIILYLIGTNNHSGKIWIELCNHMLDLATDSDIAVKQMFEPLIIQITHYLSQSSRILGTGVQILLDCLLEGISNKSNTSIRDLSARCIREFLTWCIKHTTREQLDASAVNFNILISKLKLYCFHSCNYKRFGAALAFNNLYRIFREEDALINMYALDLLYMYCINFQLTNELNTHHMDKINLEQVSLCLDHVVRMIRERKNLLNQSDTRRIKPLPFDGGDTLKDAILWLLTQCASKKQYYREKCINLYMQLAPCVNDMGNSAVQFFKQTQTIESIIKLCEGADNGIALLSHPNLSFIKDKNRESELAMPLIYTWLEHFLTSIDCYVWLLGDGFINDVEIVLQKSILFNVIQYYIEEICWLSVSDIIVKLDLKLPGTSTISSLNFNIEMVDKIETIKCTILLRIMEFIVKILPNNKQWFPLEFWSNEHSRKIIDLILHLIFHPQDLGLNNKYKDTIGKVAQQIEILLTTLLRHSPSSFSEQLQCKLIDELLNRYENTINTAEEYLSSDAVPVRQIHSVKGIELLCKQIKKSGILFSEIKIDNIIEIMQINANKLLQHLFDGLKKKIFTDYYPVRPSPTIKRYANQLINICFLSAIKFSSSFFDNVIELMLNTAELKIENSAIIKHGNYFTDIYKLSIFEYLLNTFEMSLEKLVIKMTLTNIVYIVNILINFMEYLYKYKQYDKMCLQSIVTILLEHCSNMLEIVNANKIDVTIQFLFIEYISNIAMICPFQLNRIGEMANGLQPFLLTIIDAPENSIKLKSRAIFLIPCICGPDQHTHDALTKTLYNLHSQYFPIKSAEFVVGSLERSAFCNTFQMLLDALVISQSSVLLTFLINITISDDKHILEYAIQDAIEKFMKNQMDTNRQVHCLTIPFTIFEDMTLEPTIRLTVIKRYLLSMIRHSYVESIIIFYTNKIKRILEMTETNYALANAGWNVEHALVNRIGAYQLIEILFGTVKRETLQNCSIGTAALTGADKSAVFFGVVTKKPYSARNDIFVTDDLVAAEYFRQYQCAAYNALCAIICNTQIDLKYYTIFLFKELPTENKLIWQKLINTKDDNLYVNNFPQIFDKYPKIKQRLVSIRQTAVDTSDGININSAASNKSKTTVDGRRRPIKYIQSQNIFDSSLSQDVTKLDLNFSNVRTTAEVAALENVQDTVSIPLEKLTINTHEIMATLCAVIKHMYDNKITPISEDPIKIRKAAPKWVELICNIIVDTRQPKNIRLFLGKVIENCRHIFCHYAAVVTKPIMQLLVDECAGNTLNCYVIDMIVMLIEWDTLYKIESNEECHLASDLFKFCMKNVWFDRKEIFRRNLEICKCLLEIWKEQIVVPKQFLFDSINKSNRTEARDNLCGIQLNAIILANNLIPWTDDTLCVYFRLLYQCLENEYTSIYQPTSQLLGMCLAHIQSLLEDDANTRNEQIHNIYAELINILTTLKFKNDKKFTDIIYGIQKYYPKIIDSFLLIISNYITNSSGALKRIYLEMFLARCDTYEQNVYREISAIGIKDLLKMKEFKLLALHIINKTISKMNAIDIAAIFNDIKLFVNDENQLCRDVTYEIFIYIHEHIDDDVHTNTIDGISLRKQTTTLLLNGLSDSDLQIQNRIFKFWSNEINLPLKPDERILKLFGELYDSNSEKYFLSFCTQLLLEPAIQEPYAKRQIFEHETVTTDSKLHEYEINLSWRKQNSLLMAPLFTETNQDQVISADFSNQQFLRATLSEVAFEPTHDPKKIFQTPNNFTLQSHNSLLFQIQSQVLDRRSNRITEFNQQQQHHHHQHQQQQHQYEQQNNNETNILNRLRKRFISDRDTIGKNMAYKAIEKHKYELDVQSLQKKQKEGHVTLFRRYRYGDYPDLLINNLALLLPLQGLVKRDPILSRKVLVSIFTSIVTELNPADGNIFMATTSQHIETIFNNTKTCDSLVFSTLIEIALINPKIFIISPQIISMIANANQMMPIGILYIENRLNYMNDEDDENETAKISTTSIDVDEQHWLELSNLYLSLSEYDVVAGIFSDKLKTDHVLVQAIEYETNGNYLMAQKHYLESIHKQRPLEEDFAYRSYFNCLELMANWSLLSKYTKDQITNNNMEEFWTDNWNKEILLPHYIKSNLYLILDGKREAYTLEFLQTMTDWMGNIEKSQYVEQTFGEELMMLEITNKNYLQARVHSEQHLMRLLSEWSNLSILSNKVRTEKLLNIRKVSEIYKFTELLLSLTSAATTTTTTTTASDLPDLKKLEKFVNNLTYSRPELSDSTLLWNCITSYRRYICLLIMNQLKNHIDSNRNVKQLYKSFTNCIFDMNFNLLRISLEQKNIQLASKILYSLSDYENKENDIKSLEWAIAKSKQQKFKSRLSNDSNVAIQLLLKSWQSIDTIVLNNIHINNFIENYPDIYMDALNEIVAISNEISMRYQNENVNIKNYAEMIFERTSTSKNSNIDIRMHEHSLNCLQKCIKIVEDNIEMSDSASTSSQYKNLTNNATLANAYYNLAQYTYDSYENQRIQKSEFLEKTLIISVLRGMQYDSKECRQMFPLLLQLPNLINNNLKELFNHECFYVPEWMFLAWIPQILSRFDFLNICFIDNLLNRISIAYPSAIIYPFQLSYNQYQTKHSQHMDRELIRQIQKRINIPIVMDFIKALNYLCLPEKMIEHYIRDIYSSCDEYCLERINNALRIVYGDDKVFQGKAYNRIQKYKKILEEAKLYANDFSKVISILQPHLTINISSYIEESTTLESLSPWLHKFQWHLNDVGIEIPGQYCGTKCPNINNHIKIVKFDAHLKIHKSKRKPIEFIIHGSNTKTYNFIIKYGEDLRQDQRIQQLLTLMNNQLQNDKNCCQNNLFLNTFNIIPLNYYCGMIECFDNTKTAQEVISACMERRLSNSKAIIGNLYVEYGKYLDDAVKDKRKKPNEMLHIHGKAVVHYTREKIISKFQEIQYKIPQNILKLALTDICISPESFFALRNNFATSLATMSIAHWILGIGDRHLSNMLFNMENGSVIGIDFGLTFGAGTRDLNIPEMVPFRLTPQFVNTMNPLGTSGFMSKCMIHVLRALRANSKLLIACMDVFVHEPTIDWLESARVRVIDNYDNVSLSSSDSIWDPNVRIKVAKNKLNGINPKIVCMEDLSMSSILAPYPEYVQGYKNILNGHPQHNVRAQLDSHNLTVEQQVACLIDMATDPALLGLCYAGFQPWI